MSEIENLSASIRQRLLNKAHETNRPFDELLQYYAIERFLYRLFRSSHGDQFILKGALMFQIWGETTGRPTRDIGLLGHVTNDLDVLKRIIREVCLQEVEPDGLTFDMDSIRGERIIVNADYSGARINFSGFLGKGKIPMQIDIGFADVVFPKPVRQQYPTLFAMPSPWVYGYPPESAVAEKFQAMVFLGAVNSRMKDFYDLWLLAEKFEYAGSTLQKAIRDTFRRRKTAIPGEVPAGLSDTFAAGNQAQWQAFLRRTGIRSAPASLLEVIRILQRCLLPLINTGTPGRRFNAVWKPGGPWSSKSS